jgi:hypothetical protein
MSFEKLKLQTFTEGKFLEGMYTYQRHLMTEYESRGMIQSYPLLLDTRKSQEYIKKMVYWILEELAEASEKYKEVMDLYMAGSDKKELSVKLNECFIEVADSTAFIIEFLITCGIEKIDVEEYYSMLLKERNLELLNTDDGLKTALGYAHHVNTYDDPVRETICLAVPIEVNMVKVDFKISEDLVTVVELAMWETAKAFLLAGNALKNRDWASTERTTNINQFHHAVMRGWCYFTKLVNLMGMDATSLYLFFEKKTLVNQNRLIDGY